MNENQKKSVFDLPKMVTDDPKDNFEVMLNLVYGKDGWSHIRYSEDGTDGMPITDFCFKKLCPEFGCSAFADQTMTDEEKDEFLFDCVFDNCPVATVYAAFSGYGHLRDRLRQHEDAMTNRVLTLEEVSAHCAEGADAMPLWFENRKKKDVSRWMLADTPEFVCDNRMTVKYLLCTKMQDYGETWRCWLRKPTKEEMEGTPWES